MPGPIVPRRELLAALIRALATGRSPDQAVAAVAAEYALPEEAVREIIDELEVQHG